MTATIGKKSFQTVSVLQGVGVWAEKLLRSTSKMQLHN